MADSDAARAVAAARGTRPHLVTQPGHWIEGEAVRQLESLVRLLGVRHVVGLPDLHPGRGYPVGAAVVTSGLVYPHLVGNDIGCGMSLYETELSAHRTRAQGCARRLVDLDGRWTGDARAWLTAHGVTDVTSADLAGLGTIGGGNHFAELGRIEEIYEDDVAAAHGLSSERLFLLVHSGSRGLGESILRAHADRYRADPLDVDTEAARRYLASHDRALTWARANRSLIAHRVCAALRSEHREILDVFHNFVERTTHAGEELWVHRKGAASSHPPLGVLPGSRGAWTFLVEPLDGGYETAWSLAHGAGRRWRRSDARGKLGEHVRASDLERTALGSTVICEDRELLFEEAPQAYKNVDAVLACLMTHGLARPIAKLRPFLTYKVRRAHA